MGNEPGKGKTARDSRMERSHRGQIHQAKAKILSHVWHPGDQWILRFEAAEIARHAEPGSFVHITCDPALPMRRPMSIMRTDPDAGWVECLYKVVGKGTGLLARHRKGDVLDVLGPIGRPFELRASRPRPLLIGGGVGIPPMVFLADRLRERNGFSPFAILGSEIPFPFKPTPSQILVDGIPDGVIATMPLLEDWGIPTRLASGQGFSGCFDGLVTELADHWLRALSPEARSEVEIHACGPTPMLAAVARLAQAHELPCQVALEEYMACAVGGCAGCVVRVEEEGDPAMRRVCVDGPVFDAHQVFPPGGEKSKSGLFH